MIFFRETFIDRYFLGSSANLENSVFRSSKEGLESGSTNQHLIRTLYTGKVAICGRDNLIPAIRRINISLVSTSEYGIAQNVNISQTQTF